MNRRTTAHDLFWQIIAEWDVDMALISEPYRDSGCPSWMTNVANMTAIWVPKDRGISGRGIGRDCVWVIVILDKAARLGLTVMNEGSVPTYRRPGFGNSIPDVTFSTEGIA